MNQIQKAIKRFRKRFNDYPTSAIWYEPVLDFLQQELERVYKEGLAEGKAFIGKAKREWYERGFKEGKDRYKDLVAPPEFKNKAAVAEDICKIINNIEFSYRNTNLEEWKAFKHIRNAIRDKYVLTPKETYEEGYAKGQLDMIDIYNITPKDCNCGGNEENGHNESCKFYEEWA